MNRDDQTLSQTLAAVAELYAGNLDDHGLDSRSVGWRDHTSQRLRFTKLAEVIEPEAAKQGISINDFGCGYGAMFRFLDQLPGVRVARYYGYDISAEMLKVAPEFAGDERAAFLHSEKVTETADYSFVSGTFNVRLGASDSLWTEYIHETLLTLAARSHRGFAFNLLSTYVDWKKEDLFYGNPLHFFDFCKRHISPRVSLLHDYPLWEWTILVRKEGSE